MAYDRDALGLQAPIKVTSTTSAAGGRETEYFPTAGRRARLASTTLGRVFNAAAVELPLRQRCHGQEAAGRGHQRPHRALPDDHRRGQ